LTVPRVSGPDFMFCAPGPVFGGTEDSGSSFCVLRSRTHFRRYRRRQVDFSCFALPDPFSAVPRAPCHVFIFYALGPVMGGTEGAGYRYHVWRSRTHFGRQRGSAVSKIGSGAQNLKTRPDTLGTAENESGSAKYENKTRHPRYRRKRVLEPKR
jgi:hypothetical protein